MRWDWERRGGGNTLSPPASPGLLYFTVLHLTLLRLILLAGWSKHATPRAAKPLANVLRQRWGVRGSGGEGTTRPTAVRSPPAFLDALLLLRGAPHPFAQVFVIVNPLPASRGAGEIDVYRMLRPLVFQTYFVLAVDDNRGELERVADTRIASSWVDA